MEDPFLMEELSTYMMPHSMKIMPKTRVVLYTLMQDLQLPCTETCSSTIALVCLVQLSTIDSTLLLTQWTTLVVATLRKELTHNVMEPLSLLGGDNGGASHFQMSAPRQQQNQR